MLLSQICYFFYKNIAFGLTLFYFEAFTGFSGQSIFNDSYLLLFNVVLTSLPVISLGVFEQDVPSDVCLEVIVSLYHLHIQNKTLPKLHIFASVFIVPCIVSTRPQEPVLRLVQDPRMDGEWSLRIHSHLHTQPRNLPCPIIPL